ncbi:uncharacterized protein [Hyperolius riggenbachi]|uniref:uncharacterized protein isoform X2 n=1 Tax=Hyperolius riggenbachi TaxID=752182 RepID=UPI0035A2B27F
MEFSNHLFTMWTLVIDFLSKRLGFLGFRLLCTRSTVGIFSREDKSCYTFLHHALRSQDLLVSEVRTFLISNSRQQEFQEEVARCRYAILYHSRRRGRLNITNVTDSLYDEELTKLSEMLGRDHVIVVADDLDSSSSEDKQMILHNQPLIAEMAKDLIVFSTEDKIVGDNTMRKKIHQILQHIDSTAPILYRCEEAQSHPLKILMWSILAFPGVFWISVLKSQFNIAMSILYNKISVLKSQFNIAMSMLYNKISVLKSQFNIAMSMLYNKISVLKSQFNIAMSMLYNKISVLKSQFNIAMSMLYNKISVLKSQFNIAMSMLYNKISVLKSQFNIAMSMLYNKISVLKSQFNIAMSMLYNKISVLKSPFNIAMSRLYNKISVLKSQFNIAMSRLYKILKYPFNIAMSILYKILKFPFNIVMSIPYKIVKVARRE